MIAWDRALLAPLLLGGCLGQPELVNCEDDPAHALCGGGTETDTSASQDTEPATGTTGADVPGLSPLSVTMVGQDVVVGNDAFEITFTEADNFMPSRWTVPGAAQSNLLYTGQEIHERLMGVHMFDRSFSYQPGPRGQSVTLWEQGDVIVRMLIEWDTPANGERIQSGNGNPTTFQITPDGRVTRAEHVHVVARTDATAYWLSAYVALDPALFTGVEVRGGASQSYDLSAPGTHFFPADPPDDVENLDPTMLCAFNSETGVAVGFWADPYLTVSDSGGHRPAPGTYGWGLRGAHAVAGGEASLGLQFDWLRASTPDETVYHAPVVSMAIVAPEAPCDRLEAHFEADVDPPALTVVGGENLQQFTGSQEDDSDTYFNNGGYYAVQADENPFSVSVGRPPPSLLMRVVGVGQVAADGFAVTLDGAPLEAGVDFLTQRSDLPDQGFYVFLARELPAGAPLEVSYTSAG